MDLTKSWLFKQFSGSLCLILLILLLQLIHVIVQNDSNALEYEYIILFIEYVSNQIWMAHDLPKCSICLNAEIAKANVVFDDSEVVTSNIASFRRIGLQNLQNKTLYLQNKKMFLKVLNTSLLYSITGFTKAFCLRDLHSVNLVLQ